MTAHVPALAFASAYRQLRPVERSFVDAYVADVERDAQRKNERISLALHRVIPAHVVEASRGMLDRPMVRAAIAERINELAATSELTHHRVVKEWMNVAFSSMGDYMRIGEDGSPYFDLARCTPEQLAAIKSIEIEEGSRGNRKFKLTLHDKLAGLRALSEYMGMLNPDNPFWKADSAKPVTPAPLPATVTTDGAADAWSQMINGG